MSEEDIGSHSEAVLNHLAHMEEFEARHREFGKKMLTAYGGALYGLDLLAVGALNRSLAHCAGFKSLLEARNLICAGAILRLQLDTALRFYASFIVEKPHDFAVEVLKGTPVYKMKDADGNLMRDAYLVERLGKDHSWVPRVYKETSGYIHFSDKHLMSAFSPDQDGNRFLMKMSAVDKDLPDAIYLEAIEAFYHATGILLSYIKGWVFTKDNPDTVEQMREAREQGASPEGV